MVDPAVRNDGNLRFAGIHCPGYPVDPDAVAERVRSGLRGQEGVATYGPTVLLFSLPPHDHPSGWECQVGTAVTGLPRPPAGMAVEDYHALRALVLPHTGAIRDLDATHRRLVEHGRTLGHTIRPYWRLTLGRKRLADGNALPAAEVSVFVDSW
jgi:hypothetical protein